MADILSTKTTDHTERIVFPEESIDKLTSDMYVTYILKRERKISRNTIIDYNIIKREIHINYRTYDGTRNLIFKKETITDHGETIGGDVVPVLQDQPELDSVVNSFLKEKLPPYMVKLLP